MPSSKQIGATSSSTLDKPARSSSGLLISIVCLIVGYLGGSINSIDILKEKGNVVSSSVGQMVVMKNMTTNFASWHELWSHRAVLSYLRAITVSPISIVSST